MANKILCVNFKKKSYEAYNIISFGEMKQSVQTDNEIDRFASGSAPNHAENGIAHLILLLALSGV